MAAKRLHASTMLIDISPCLPTDGSAAKPIVVDKQAKRITARSLAVDHYKKKMLGPTKTADFKELFQGVYDAAFITDLEGYINDANVRATLFFERTKKELRNKNISDIIIGLNPSMLETISRNLENDQFTLIQAHCARKDATLFSAEISSSRISLANAEYLCFFIRDVTARRNAEEALQCAHHELECEVAEHTKANENLHLEIAERTRIEEELKHAIVQLKEHDKARMQFVSNVSHEFRTPLTSISYMADNMLKGVVGDIPDRALEYLHMVKEDCQRLTRAVEDILDMSRLDADTLTLSLVRLPFARFIRRVVNGLKIQAMAQHQELVVHLPDGAGFVECDPKKMERIAYNVIKNAIQYTPQNGTVEIRLCANPDVPNFLFLEVEDNGIGIEPEYLDRVTERYFRVGEYVSGTGLGLAICKELLERHGGGIELKSPPPNRTKGTLVSICVPLVPPSNLLVVSDESSVKDELVNQFAGQGYQVYVADNGDEALAILPNIVMDAICLDWSRPGMDGGVLVAKLKSNSDLSQIPLVAITGDSAEGVKQEILDGMGIPALGVPWQQDNLLDQVEEIVMKTKHHMKK